MANNNEVRLTGNLGKDAEFRANVGNGLATFSLAINRYRPTDEGYEKMKTDWFRCVAWGKLADKVAQLKKGERVTLVGRLESRDWKDKKGFEHSSVEIVVENISRAETLKGTQPAATSAEPAQEPMLAIEEEAEELPLDATDGKPNTPTAPVVANASNPAKPKPVNVPATPAAPASAPRSRRSKTAA